MEICVLEAKVLVSLHICTGSLEPSLQYQNPMCMLGWRCVCHLCEQRIKALVSIHKAAQVHLSLLILDNLKSTKLFCWPEMRFRCHI